MALDAAAVRLVAARARPAAKQWRGCVFGVPRVYPSGQDASGVWGARTARGWPAECEASRRCRPAQPEDARRGRAWMPEPPAWMPVFLWHGCH